MSKVLLTSKEDETRTRAPNFTAKEERILVELVKKYYQIVECKRTDALSNHEKIAAWRKLAEEYNAVNECYRNSDVLKKKFDNLKKRCKQLFAAEKARNKGTGGGKFLKTEISDVDIAVKELLTIQVTGRSSHFDCDQEETDSDDENEQSCMNKQNMESVCLDEESQYQAIGNNNTTRKHDGNINDDKNEKNFFTDTSSNLNTQNGLDKAGITAHLKKGMSCVGTFLGGKRFSASMLRQPVTSELIPKTTSDNNMQEKSRDNPENIEEISANDKKSFRTSRSNIQKKCRTRQPDLLKTKLGQWANSKFELVQLQKQFLEEEHKRKMAYLDKKYELELKHMQEEHETRLHVLNERNC